MPSFVRQVDFAPAPVYSREARDDERFVMRQFCSHAKRCEVCCTPYETHMAGGSLCDRGLRYALNVFQYIYNKGGKAYSLVDREREQRVQVEIPAGCGILRDLLRAIDRGMRLSSRAPVVSYDQNYYVAERPVRTETRPAAYAIVERPVSPRRHRSTVYHTSSSGGTRGSLYVNDYSHRRSRYHEDPVYDHQSPRIRAPREYELRR